MQNGQVSFYSNLEEKKAHDANLSVSDGAKALTTTGILET
jgi:hypothetical protein